MSTNSPTSASGVVYDWVYNWKEVEEERIYELFEDDEPAVDKMRLD